MRWLRAAESILLLFLLLFEADSSASLLETLASDISMIPSKEEIASRYVELTNERDKATYLDLFADSFRTKHCERAKALLSDRKVCLFVFSGIRKSQGEAVRDLFESIIDTDNVEHRNIAIECPLLLQKSSMVSRRLKILLLYKEVHFQMRIPSLLRRFLQKRHYSPSHIVNAYMIDSIMEDEESFGKNLFLGYPSILCRAIRRIGTELITTLVLSSITDASRFNTFLWIVAHCRIPKSRFLQEFQSKNIIEAGSSLHFLQSVLVEDTTEGIT